MNAWSLQISVLGRAVDLRPARSTRVVALELSTPMEEGMPYVDGFVLPVPKRKLAVYRRMARKAG
jgi:hypothetical protein